MSFGSYDLISLAEAREKRDTARKQVASGIDPLEERKAQKLAQQISIESSFEAICREWHANKADGWTVAYREEIITGRAEYNPAPDLAIALAVPKQKHHPFYPLKSYLILFGILRSIPAASSLKMRLRLLC